MVDNDFLKHDNNAFMVFTKLLMIVNKKDGKWSGGRRQLALIMNINERTLYDVVIRLELQQMINRTPNSKYTVINISNWQKYQSSPTAQTTTAQPQPNQTPTTAQHSNKKENKKENKNSTKVLVNSDEPTSRPSQVSHTEFLKMLIEKLGFSDRVMATAGRVNKLKVRLKTFKPADLMQVAQLIAEDPYMQGDNDSGKRYGTIDYMLRSDEIIDRYLNSDNVKSGGPLDESKYL